jgi:membrane-associated protease RseP (regulator of RpoE activity)
VQKCVLPAPVAGRPAPQDCPPGAAPTPAAASGLRPGDVVVSLAGVHYDSWETFQRAARKAAGTLPLVISRGGSELTLSVTPVQADLPRLDDPSRYERAAFLGLEPTIAYQRQGPGLVFATLGQYVSMTGSSLIGLPGRVPALFRQAILHEQRSQNTPLSVVGVSRLGGQVLDADIGWKSRVEFFLRLLTAVNLSMFLLNLLPLPPFDGGHIMAAAWESVRRRLARLLGRGDPGPVDLAKLMPVAYAVGLVFISYSVLLVIADVFNPVQLS